MRFGYTLFSCILRLVTASSRCQEKLSKHLSELFASWRYACIVLGGPQQQWSASLSANVQASAVRIDSAVDFPGPAAAVHRESVILSPSIVTVTGGRSLAAVINP